MEVTSITAPRFAFMVDHIKELVLVAEGRSSEPDPLVPESWRRCMDHDQLDPSVLRPAIVVEERQFHDHRVAMEEQSRTARFGVEVLYRQTAELGYVRLLTDKHGITVDHIGDEATTDKLCEAGLNLGAVRNEARAGTNCTGTCVATGKARTVHQTDHFDTTHIPLSCTVALILNPAGNLSAVPDESALSLLAEKSSQCLALQSVRSFAHRIETANLIRSCLRSWIVKLTLKQTLAEVDVEYGLVLNPLGRITGFNHYGLPLLAQELCVDWRDGRLFTGRPISDFVDCEIDSLTHYLAPHAIERTVIRLRASGRKLFILVVPPKTSWVLPAAITQDEHELHPALKGTVGDDLTIQNNLNKLLRLLNTNMSTLVSGETGTGKEFLAKAIHQATVRGKGLFIPVNCAALLETLIESELFAYQNGSFTGALAKGKEGVICEAHGDTRFLDKIGDIPLSPQTWLLWVLADRELMRIGGLKPASVDMRVSAASHRDLPGLVKQGTFREDKSFRVDWASIGLLPLRSLADLEFLLSQLIEKRCHPDGVPRHPSALGVLAAHNWPGNIRELVNSMDFVGVVAADPEIIVDGLPDQVLRRCYEGLPAEPVRRAAAVSDEAAALHEDLRRAKWNVSASPRLLGIERTTLHRRMRRLGMSLPRRSTSCHTCVGRRNRDGYLCAINRRLGFLSGIRRNIFVVTQRHAVCRSNSVTYEGAIAVT